MTSNPSNIRPDIARTDHITHEPAGAPPRIGMVSLGCPKALVDSERILSRLRAEGYAISTSYAGADAVIVNTCGFLDSAKEESLEVIGDALKENGQVIVTGCLGANPDYIQGHHPNVLAITGPHQYEAVVSAVRKAAPLKSNPYIDLIPQKRISLTPRHYSYLKISEGCNHRCKFCIIPQMRGRLVSLPMDSVLREAERLVENGVRELLVISQDSGAYGMDLRHTPCEINGRTYRTHLTELAGLLGQTGAWVRLHYVYPYPAVADLVALMGEGKILPYLDVPFQHAHPETLKRMARPAAGARALDQITNWRAICPNLTLRSTFIVGYPGETEAEFQTLLDWLEAAQIDRVGCFKYENVKGARSNDLDDHVPEELKEERWHRFMEKARAISAEKLAAKVGTRQRVIVDLVEADAATCRTMGDAPEIDGNLFIDTDHAGLSPGDILDVTVDEASEYDLWGLRIET